MGSNNIILTTCAPTLNRILHNCQALSPGDVKNMLMIYDEHAGYLGDFCTRFDKVRYVKQFFTNASIRLNYTFAKDGNFIHSLFCQDPYLNSVTNSPWDEIDFNAYEVVFIGSNHQLKLLAYLQARYRDRITSGQFRTAVYSASEVLIHLSEQDFTFPICERLRDFIWRIPNKTGEICITEDEQEWAGRWLEARGLQPHERLVIFLDSTTYEQKLMDTRVYLDILGNMLARKDIKVLVFDESGIGKEQFYREKLGDKEKMKKMIFSSGQTLRQDLSIIASRYTRMVFGPCTGLLHCASSIYNYYVNNGIRSRFEVPSLIVYTGQYPGSRACANTWWGTSPLVDALLLREVKKKKNLVLLSSLAGDEKNTKDVLPSKDYPAQLIIDFIDKKLRPLKEKIYG